MTIINRRTGLPKHCSFSTDRHGKKRVRFRKGGFSTYRHDPPHSEEFYRAYQSALEGVSIARRDIGAQNTIPGSVDSLCVKYYRSAEFLSLKSSTQSTYRGIIERFRVDHGKKRLGDLERKHIRAIIGSMSDRPSAANNLLRILRMLLNHAVDIEMIKANPATEIKGYRIRSDGFHTWTDDEIEHYRSVHPMGTKAQLALEILLGTGQRRGDVIRMGKQHVKDGWLDITQQKTGTRVEIPIAGELAKALDMLGHDNLTFLMTEYGRPFTGAGFGNWFRDQCRAAGLKNVPAHGLRKAAATRLAEAGCSNEEIKAITGHKTDKEVTRYTRAADKKKLAKRAHDRLEREQKLSNLDKGLDKNTRK